MGAIKPNGLHVIAEVLHSQSAHVVVDLVCVQVAETRLTITGAIAISPWGYHPPSSLAVGIYIDYSV